MSKSLRGKGGTQLITAFWIKLVARRCGATDVMSPNKANSQPERNKAEQESCQWRKAAGPREDRESERHDNVSLDVHTAVL